MIRCKNCGQWVSKTYDPELLMKHLDQDICYSLYRLKGATDPRINMQDLAANFEVRHI